MLYSIIALMANMVRSGNKYTHLQNALRAEMSECVMLVSIHAYSRYAYFRLASVSCCNVIGSFGERPHGIHSSFLLTRLIFDARSHILCICRRPATIFSCLQSDVCSFECVCYTLLHLNVLEHCKLNEEAPTPSS